jgi:drug/metabolite transporter (DMT)-like permease
MTTEERAPAAGPAAEEDAPPLAATLMVGSLALLGLQDALVKIASAEVSLWQFQLLRSALNLVLLLALARVLWGGLPPRPISLRAVALRSTLLVGAMVCFFGGVPFLALSEIAAGLYVFPLFVAVLSAAFLGERVGPRRVLAILAGFAGTLLILKPGTEAFRWVALMPVAAGLCYGATVLVTRRLCRRESPATLAFGVALAFLAVGAAGLALAPFAPGRLAGAWPYLFTGWHAPELWLLGIVAACSCLNLAANMGLAKAYQSAESSWLAPFDYSYLVFATLWGAAIFGDLPDAASALGMAMIAGAGAYVAWRERRESRLARADMNRALR